MSHPQVKAGQCCQLRCIGHRAIDQHQIAQGLGFGFLAQFRQPGAGRDAKARRHRIVTHLAKHMTPLGKH